MTLKLLTISGSLRRGSVNAAALNTARDLAPSNVAAQCFDDLSRLPHFNPDDDREPLPVAVAEVRRAVTEAGVVLFSTPEYAGDLPGSFKNLLDWLVGSIALRGKPVAWINTASPAAPAAGEDAYQSLRRVLGYVEADIVETACIRLPVPRHTVQEDRLTDPESRRKIAGAVKALCDRHWSSPAKIDE